jgi:hypothetical protein
VACDAPAALTTITVGFKLDAESCCDDFANGDTAFTP